MPHSDDGAKQRREFDMDDGQEMDEEDYELDQEQIIQTILVLGNEIWKNFGQTQPLDDVRIFFQHTFYIQCFQMAYPDFDFSSLMEDDDETVEPEKMAEAIQALVDLLGQEILHYDMSHIQGEEIVGGNPEHCINLLQILQQISSASMMQDEESEAQNSSPGQRQRSSANRSNKQGGKSAQSQEEEKEQKQEYSEIFGLDGGDGNNKQQFLDNLDDEEEGEDGQDRVGNVIGNISNQLDIEFDHEIQDNLQNNHGGQGSDNDGSGIQYDDEEMVSPNDVGVNIIDDGADFEDESEQQDEEGRPLNRQTNNIGDYNNPRDELEDGEDDNAAAYGDEIINQEDSSNFNVGDQHDNEGMEQLHEQLQGFDQEGSEEVEEDEGQHYEEEQEEDEDIIQLEEMEAQMQQQQFYDIDPELLEAAQKMGLDEQGIRELQQQMYQQQQEGSDMDDEGEEQQDSEGGELAEMLNDQQQHEGQQIYRGGDNISDEDGQEIDSEMAEQLKQLNQNPDGIDDDDEENPTDMMMDHNGNQIDHDGDDQQDFGEEQEQEEEDDLGDEGEDDEDDEDQLIDIDNLNDNEKAILVQYLQDEYNKNPDQLPMPKEVIEQFLADNQGLIQNMQHQGHDEGDDDGIVYGQQNINDGAMVIQGEHNELASDEIHRGEQEVGGDEGEDQDAIAIENQQHALSGEEEFDEDQPLYNPQYQHLQERDQFGNLIMNVNTQNAAAQAQQMLLHPRKTKKKKAAPAQSVRKPPLGANIAAAQSKKPRRSKIPGMNTISHDDENRNPNGIRYGGMGESLNLGRKTNSQKRPGTAKPRKGGLISATGSRPTVKKNNFMGPGRQGGTPQNRAKGSRGALLANTHGLVVPQSQMFTSFGMPQGRPQPVNTRKAASGTGLRRKPTAPVASSNTFSKKKLKPQSAKPKKATAQQLQQQQFYQPQTQAEMQQVIMQNQVGPANLVEMPILSEDFLNQLNEEQLQALLEQQQQLMMMQQQQTVPNEIGETNIQEEVIDEDGEVVLEEDEEQQEEDGQEQEMMEGDEEPNGEDEEAQQQMLMAQQQAMLMQQYQQQMMQDNSNIRRGRAKAQTSQSGRVAATASRGHGISAGKGGSGSRSKNGSKKRSNKTRSSLNLAGGLPIGSVSAGPQSVSVLPSSLSKSKKVAAQIYGNASAFNNLVSQSRRKPASASNSQGKKKAGKRSQPNQGLKNQLQFHDMQAQLEAQQAQYTMMNQQQLLLAQQQQQQQQFYQEGDEQEQSEIQEQAAEGAIIDEASPEQEDGESQSQQFHQGRTNQAVESNIQGNQLSNIAEDLSTEQIIELLQNAAEVQNSQNGEMAEVLYDENGEPIQQLPEEIQVQLQQVLQERMMQQQQQEFLLKQQQMQNAPSGLAMNDRVQSYQNICNILTESVSKAKEDLAHLAPGASPGKHSTKGSPQRQKLAEKVSALADSRILKQKRQFEALLKQYKQERKNKEMRQAALKQRMEKMIQRDEKIKAIKQKKFEEEMLNHQRSQMFKRNAQQVRMCKKVYKLASDLEKNKLLEEKKQFKETEAKKNSQKQKMVDTIENYYKDKITMLKERIDSEKFERHIAQEAQKKALSQMKKELDSQKHKELQRYIQLLQQEDEKYDVQNMYLGRLENEIVKLYKKQ